MAAPTPTRLSRTHSLPRLPLSVDALAIGIALGLAALIRFGVIHHISF